jgi:hypothetical protein
MSGRPVVTLAVPCRTDEPELGRTLETAWRSWTAAPASATQALEVLVCLNGGDALGAPAHAQLAAFAAAHGVALADVDADAGGALPPRAEGALGVVALATRRAGKPHAWNLLRAYARSAVVLFCDADVDFAPPTLGVLLGALDANPHAVLASPRTACAARPTAFERIMAAPYRVDWPNLSAQLYAARRDGLPATMPDDLIEPERWLELVVGTARIVRHPEVQVVVRLPGTLRDFFRQRIRIEMGKVQIEDAYASLLAASAPQPSTAARLRMLGVADTLRGAVYLALRAVAHRIARRRWRAGRTAGVWVQAASTKRWGAPAPEDG